MPSLIEQYSSQVQQALRTVPEARLIEAVQALLAAHQRQATVFVLCSPQEEASVRHFVQSLGQGIGAGAWAFRLVNLYGSPKEIVAWQNDWAYEDLYAEQVRGVIHRGDLVMAVSRRGESLGMLRAMEAARRAGATTLAIVGFDGGAIRDAADICLHVRSTNAEQVDDVQVMLMHMLCAELRRMVSRDATHEAALAAYP